MKDTYIIRPDNRPMKPHSEAIRPTESEKVYFILLQDQICIISPYWQNLKLWRKHYADKRIEEIHETRKKVTNSHLKSGVMSLSQFIEFNPAEYNGNWP